MTHEEEAEVESLEGEEVRHWCCSVVLDSADSNAEERELHVCRGALEVQVAHASDMGQDLAYLALMGGMGAADVLVGLLPFPSAFPVHHHHRHD
jgi:hypothetical protein